MARASDRYEVRSVAPTDRARAASVIWVFLDFLDPGGGTRGPIAPEYVAVFERGGKEVARSSVTGEGLGSFLNKIERDLTELSEEEFVQQWGIKRDDASA